MAFKGFFSSNGNKSNITDNNGQNQSSQYSLHDGNEIFECIKRDIRNAQKSIWVAAAWFTDQELFDELVNKYEYNPNIEIRIILDGNKDNFYLPFKKIADFGGQVRLIRKEAAFGRMHDKFSLFDGVKLISGSYNWSKNARSNNDENVIVTEDSNLVEEFKVKFNSLFEKSINFDPDNLHKIDEELEEIENPLDVNELSISEYEELLNELIYAQVLSYDDEKLLNLGKERSQSCYGDADNLQQELDSVYLSFIRDIQISDEKKEIIKSSIKQQLERTKGELDNQCQSKFLILDKELNFELSTNEKEISILKEEINNITAESRNLEQNELKHLGGKITESENKIESIKTDNFRPKIPLYSFIPNIIFLFLVTVYSIVFYSSAAYILIYSQNDAKAAKLNKKVIENPEIFDGSAIEKALGHGIVSFLFVILVPIFILGLIYVVNKNPIKWQRYSILILAILFIDGFTAYKVAESIHNVDYLKGQTDVVWHFGLVWSNSDFYLVLVFGLLALVTFEFLLSHVFNILDKRNLDIKYLQSRERIAAEQSKISDLNESIKEVKNKIVLLETESKNKNDRVLQLEKYISKTELEIERKKHEIKIEIENQKSSIENVTNLKLTKIENEKFTFSPIYIYDRISIFMRGWKDFLHDHFANRIAVEKSRLADNAVDLWKKENLNNSVRTH